MINDQITQEMIEQMIGERFRIDELAGNGGFGDVYRGFDNRMSRPVAIKVVRSLGDKEADVLINLDHRGLPRLYDVIRGEEVTVMIMEWIPGVDLEKYITLNGSLSERTSVRIGLELLDILDYLHHHKPNIIYQDLKPSNIMMMPDGHVKLVDFGTALVMDYGDEDMILAGTVGYGAPEQRGITGERHAGTGSDIYAWGAVMYSLLSGIMLNHPPYTMKRIRTVCPGISYGVSHVVSVCTRRNEKDRYSDVQSVSRALSRRNATNAVCRFLFTALYIMCVLPFIWIWKRMYISGDFTLMEQRLNTAARLLQGRGGTDMQYLGRTVKYLIGNDRLLMNLGVMVLTGAWMLAGFKLLQDRKFIKVRRSIFLSGRRYPGLWIPTLVAGIVFGYGIGGGLMPVVSYAEELHEDEPETTLPVTILDDDGNKLLLRYNTAYEPEGELRICIDENVLDTCNGGCLRLEYVPDDGESVLTRTIRIGGDE